MLLLLIAGDPTEATAFLDTKAPRGSAVALVHSEADLNRQDATLIVCTGRFWRNVAYDSPTMLAMEKAGLQVHYSQVRR